jgi:hypothetical protein
MRLTVAAIVLIGLPVTVAAQTRVPQPGSVPQLPPIGLPLPQIGLPLAPIGLPSTTAREPRGVDVPPRGIDNGQRRGHRNGHARSNRSVVYLVPAYGWPYGYPAVDVPAAPNPPSDPQQYREQGPLTGRLRLEVEPEGVELYVDGYYAGTPGDFGGELEVEAGLHRIEMRAPGFETLELDVRIAPGRSITYRRALQRVQEKLPPAPASQPPAAAPPSKPVYFIPGCYLGNVPPKDVKLPATCDMSRMTTFTQ